MGGKGWRYACLALITLALLVLYGVLLIQALDVPELIETLLIMLVGAWVGAVGTDVGTKR